MKVDLTFVEYAVSHAKGTELAVIIGVGATSLCKLIGKEYGE
jgi:hypothetical protein